MTHFPLRAYLAIACFSLAASVSTNGQTAPAPAPAHTPATNAPAAAPATKPFAMGDVVTQAQTDETRLKTIQSRLDPDQALQEVGNELPGLSKQIDQRIAADSAQAESVATLNELQTSRINWQTILNDLADAQGSLSSRVQHLDEFLWELNQMDANWKATLEVATNNKVPSEMTGRISAVRTEIAAAAKAVQDHQAPLYSMQTKVAAQDERAKTALDSVNKQVDVARQQLFEQNRPALWNPESLAHPAMGVVGQEKASLHEQDSEVATYLKEKTGAIIVHLFIFVFLVFGFFWMRGTVKSLAEKEPALRDADHIFDVPFANALLIGLLAACWLYPGQPRLLWAAFGATALLPAIIVTRRLIDPSSFPILYAAIIAFLVDQLRYVVTPAGILSRFLFLLELVAVSIFLLAALRFKHLSASDPDQTRLKRLTRLYLHIAFFVLVTAGFANIFGFTKLSILVGNGMLDSSYFAVILYAALRIVDALAISALSIRPLSRLGMVRRHRELLYANTTVAIRWVFFAGWLAVVLMLFSLLEPIVQEGYELLWKRPISWFSIKFYLGAVLAFPITIWASFLLSRFIRFCLEEEVYPHMQLGRGVPYAASTMVHYTVLLIGFFAAVAATGTQLSQFTFLAGAFGVGLGFGLQNIMNNFVSGVILLFERPIKVGDMVQIDATTVGTVETIGIRASIILLANGAEVIVPNGNLISNPVTNWTLSNCERQVEVPITVTSKVDPQHIIDLLLKVAGAHPSVLKNPAPHAYLVTFTAAALTFRLSAWIDSADEWARVTSDLSVAINAALAKENIALG